MLLIFMILWMVDTHNTIPAKELTDEPTQRILARRDTQRHGRNGGSNDPSVLEFAIRGTNRTAHDGRCHSGANLVRQPEVP